MLARKSSLFHKIYFKFEMDNNIKWSFQLWFFNFSNQNHATFFQTAYINFIFYMDDYNKRVEHELCETQFSENYERSNLLFQKQQLESEINQQRNIFQQTEQQKHENIADKNLFLNSTNVEQQYEDIEMNKISQNGFQLFEDFNIKSGYANFSKFSHKQNCILLSNSQKNAQKYLQMASGINEQTEQNCQDQCKSQSQESQDVFSEKLSLIRGLQKKLQSLHQKLRIRPLSTNNYINEYKLDIQKDYENYSASVILNASDKKNESKIQLSQISQIKSQFPKNYQKQIINQSVESQQMLFDKQQYQQQYQNNQMDFHLNQKSILDQHCEEQFCNIKHSLKHLPSFTKNSSNQVQIIEKTIVHFVQVPYLIQVNRDDEKIQSKKSFYFQENEELHKTLFFQEQSKNQPEQQCDSMALNIDTKIVKSLQQSGINEINLDYSNGTKLLLPQDSKMVNRLIENSELSMNSSNKTYHNILKQKFNDVSYANQTSTNQILSKLLTKYNQGQIQQLQEKVKTLEVQNNELKDKIKEYQQQISELQTQNSNLWEQWKLLQQNQLESQQKIHHYKQKLRSLQLQFVQTIQIQTTLTQEKYQQQIEQYQQQQSQYANRIIMFEEMFEENKLKQAKLLQEIQKRNQILHQLKKIVKEKQNEIQNQIYQKHEIQEVAIEREIKLKSNIQNLQKENTQLKTIIGQYEKRCEEEGFFILRAQAQELKKTIQEKDLIHVQQLDQIQNRYQLLISKYQKQLEGMKKGLQKVRLNKSTSISMSAKNNQAQKSFGINSSNQSFNIKKRESIRTTRVTNSILQSSFQESSNQYFQQEIKLTKFQLRHVESINHSEEEIFLQENVSEGLLLQFGNQSQDKEIKEEMQQDSKLNQLFAFQIQNLKMENEKIQELFKKQKQQKQFLSSKLFEISSVMHKYLSDSHEAQSQSQKNEQVFKKCIEELENQYILNKKLKQQLNRAKQQQRSKNLFSQTGDDVSVISSEIIKVHPIYIQLSKKYSKSRKYIRILQNQLKDLAALPQFSLQTHKSCCKNKQEIISQLKTILSNEIIVELKS